MYSSTTGLLVRVDSRCFYLSVSTCCCYSPVSTDNRKLIEYPRKFTHSLQVFSSVSTLDFRSSVCRWSSCSASVSTSSSRSTSVSTCLHHLDQLPSQRVFISISFRLRESSTFPAESQITSEVLRMLNVIPNILAVNINYACLVTGTEANDLRSGTMQLGGDFDQSVRLKW